MPNPATPPADHANQPDSTSDPSPPATPGVSGRRILIWVLAGIATAMSMLATCTATIAITHPWTPRTTPTTASPTVATRAAETVQSDTARQLAQIMTVLITAADYPQPTTGRAHFTTAPCRYHTSIYRIAGFDGIPVPLNQIPTAATAFRDGITHAGYIVDSTTWSDNNIIRIHFHTRGFEATLANGPPAANMASLSIYLISDCYRSPDGVFPLNVHQLQPSPEPPSPLTPVQARTTTDVPEGQFSRVAKGGCRTGSYPDEETGLRPAGPPRVTFTVNTVTTVGAHASAVALVFDCHARPVALNCIHDPDGDIAEARLASHIEAVTPLSGSAAGRAETEPVLAYLAGRHQPLWCYRDGEPAASRHELADDAELASSAAALDVVR
ncbi:hypothetical protein AB0M47_27470 [Hamadaea sp. NPDC051192]|uniref:hypothetical protein n=1 Tax=Hamadaea sp. NPDC051192 TaxID=3154940 RepID=UPI00341667AF